MKVRQAVLAASLVAAMISTAWAASADDAAPTRITWLASTGQSPHAADSKAKLWFQAKVDAWLKRHPNVTLDISYETNDINGAMTHLQQQIDAGRGPDFASLDSFFLNRFYAKLQPLDAYYPAGDPADFVSFARAGMHGPDGRLKALWVGTDVRALFYRKDLVKVPPKTWDELLALAPDLEKQKITPYLFPGGRGEASVMEHLGMFWAMGGRLVDDKGRAVFGQDANRDDWVKILTFMKTAVDSGVSPRRVAGYGFEADMNPELMRGNVAMFLGGSWMASQLQDLGDKHDWAAAPIPMPTAGTGAATAAGGWTYGVFTADAAKQKLIVELVNDMAASPEGMSGEVTALGNLPTRMSVAKMDTAYFNGENTKVFDHMLSTGKARPGASVYPIISTELQVAIADVVTGQQTPEAAIDQAAKRVQLQSGE